MMDIKNNNKDSLIVDIQNKEQNQKNKNVLESSYIKGFDLIKSTTIPQA